MKVNYTIAVWATGGRFGSGVYEVHANGMYTGLVRVSDLKKKGLVNRIDHCKKAEAYLNTDEGREWFEKVKFH